MQCGYFNTSKGSKPQALEELRVLFCRLHHHLPFEVGKVAARSCERLRLLATEWTFFDVSLFLCVENIGHVTMLDPGY